ncbi:hypothetical protein T492DRAFT_850336 [Pavlovales sp. CCMP2436]|nr:hypothetical protein T492DRAFT_850336 [Pavlovales sp. CCMP2436]
MRSVNNARGGGGRDVAARRELNNARCQLRCIMENLNILHTCTTLAALCSSASVASVLSRVYDYNDLIDMSCKHRIIAGRIIAHLHHPGSPVLQPSRRAVGDARRDPWPPPGLKRRTLFRNWDREGGGGRAVGDARRDPWPPPGLKRRTLFRNWDREGGGGRAVGDARRDLWPPPESKRRIVFTGSDREGVEGGRVLGDDHHQSYIVF